MPKRILKGKVVRNKSEKTIIVDVESTYLHKKYKKYLKKNKKFAVHDENNVSKIGDIVQIIESRPISKTKKFILFDEKQKTKVKK
ncbi:MAG: 30S ribosomal protein S17 [Pelagibacteraceae bacterium]|jgi:small subunit ribosomal protein S17|nr:30S ribosomal protein S17 [Pelagibacteraceae bacterium]|tara:strand:+ start:1822 stop:2076 length:255 start_codon:yes stop_codon:yes gene_type:complete